jgi:hypothetical protein
MHHYTQWALYFLNDTFFQSIKKNRRQKSAGLWFKVNTGQKVSKTPISTNKPDTVEHICNPSYLGGYR